MTLAKPLLAAFVALGLALCSAPALAEGAPPAPVAQRFSVEVRGAGPDVILIPGLASPAAVWNGLAARLSEHERLHLVQVAGFAGAPAGANASGPVLGPLVEALHQYILANHLKRPAVIGHSLGGLVGLMLAEQHPEDVGRLMIVDSFPFLPAAYNPAASVEAVTPQAAALRDAVTAQSAEAFAASEQAAVQRFSLKPENRRKILAWALASDRTVLARATFDDMTSDARPGLPAVSIPVTVLYPYDPSMGASAQTVGAFYRKAFAALPGVRIVRVDGAYHFLMLDQPDLFAAQVDAFLK